MKERYKLLLLLVLPIMFLTGFTTVNLIKFEASLNDMNQNEILLEWTVTSVDEVERFVIERRRNTDDWHSLGEIFITNQMRTVQQKEFSYTDKDAYKSNSNEVIFQYRLKVKQLNGITADSQPTQIRYNTSAVRRTWGSIKSMFQ